MKKARHSIGSLLPLTLCFAYVAVCAIMLAQAAGSADMWYVMCKPGSEVNVRSEATTHSEIIGRLSCGDGVHVKDSYHGWAFSDHLGFEQSEGWINMGYLSIDPVTVYEHGTFFKIAANGRVAVWNDMNMSRRVSWACPGDILKFWAVSDEWALGEAGYIRTQYLADPRKLQND